MLIMENDDVYGTGYNEYGQLGIGNNDNQNIWTKIKTPKSKIKEIICEYHTMLIMENGDVYGTGYNIHGQLGIGNNKDQNIWTNSKLN